MHGRIRPSRNRKYHNSGVAESVAHKHSRQQETHECADCRPGGQGRFRILRTSHRRIRCEYLGVMEIPVEIPSGTPSVRVLANETESLSLIVTLLFRNVESCV